MYGEAKKPTSKANEPKPGKVIKTDRQVCALRFSPCGKFLVAGGTDGLVYRWDTTADPMRPLEPLGGPGGWVQALGFHPDGRRLFTADSWGRLACWAYAQEKPEPLWALESVHDGWVRALALSADGLHLATCGRDGTVRLGSADDFRDHRLLGSGGADVFSLAFHPDGQSLVSGDLFGALTHFDLETGMAVRTLEASSLYRLDRIQDVGGVRSMAFDATGQTLACAGMAPKNGGNVQGVPTILLFDWETGRLAQTIKVGNDGDGFVFDLHFHRAGFLMAASSGNPGTGKLFFHRPADSKPFFLTASMANCHALASHPGGRILAVAATNGNSNGNGRLIGKNKEYPGNWSPIHLWDVPASLA